jgi:hypothetical protein
VANWKTYTSISAAKKSGSIYYKDKNGKKMLAVTKPQLDAWKKRNKGQFKGNALTAWANAKGKDLKSSSPASSLRPKSRHNKNTAKPGEATVPKVTVTRLKSNVEKRAEAALNDTSTKPMGFKAAADNRRNKKR